MRKSLSGLLAAGTLGMLALSNTGCSIIGASIGARSGTTSLDVVLEDGSGLRCDYAWPDTSGVRTESAGPPAVPAGSRGLTVAGIEDRKPELHGLKTSGKRHRESGRLDLYAVRRIEGDQGRLLFLLDDGTRVRGGPATLDSAGVGPGDTRPASPRSLLLAQKVRGDRVQTWDSWGNPTRTWTTRLEEKRVPLDSVREFRPWHSRKGFWRGLAIGLAIDAAIVTSLAIGMSGFNVGFAAQ